MKITNMNILAIDGVRLAPPPRGVSDDVMPATPQSLEEICVDAVLRRAPHVAPSVLAEYGPWLNARLAPAFLPHLRARPLARLLLSNLSSRNALSAAPPLTGGARTAPSGPPRAEQQHLLAVMRALQQLAPAKHGDGDGHLAAAQAGVHERITGWLETYQRDAQSYSQAYPDLGVASVLDPHVAPLFAAEERGRIAFVAEQYISRKMCNPENSQGGDDLLFSLMDTLEASSFFADPARSPLPARINESREDHRARLTHLLSRPAALQSHQAAQERLRDGAKRVEFIEAELQKLPATALTPALQQKIFSTRQSLSEGYKIAVAHENRTVRVLESIPNFCPGSDAPAEDQENCSQNLLVHMLGARPVLST